MRRPLRHRIPKVRALPSGYAPSGNSALRSDLDSIRLPRFGYLSMGTSEAFAQSRLEFRNLVLRRRKAVVKKFQPRTHSSCNALAGFRWIRLDWHGAKGVAGFVPNRSVKFV